MQVEGNALIIAQNANSDQFCEIQVLGQPLEFHFGKCQNLT